MSAFMFARSALVARAFNVTLASCGATTTAYEFKLVSGNSGAYASRTMTAISSALTLTPARRATLSGKAVLPAGVTLNAGEVFA